ncbi:MAG: hypothetical protein B6I22_11780 [Desulfobacteraceae bacterium 4572_123]|nr:MAG: hypothetical protein B6I22_11780 [Desulfobacteraceae bacterium 4572_123]
MEKKPAFSNDSLPTKKEIEIKKAKEVIRVLHGAIKNYALYPENHTVAKKFINDFKICLREFVQSNGNLKLDVRKDGLLYWGEKVHQSQAMEEDLAFLLFRDGLEWIEFQEGLESSEIRFFFRIIDQFRYQKEESEGDLVTAFWEAEFTNIQYSAGYAIYDDQMPVDISSFKASEKPAIDLDQVLQEPDEAADVVPLDQSLWKLTPEEMALTRKMVAEESRYNSTEEMLRVLPVLLSRQDTREDMHSLLQFMRKGLQKIVGQGRFAFVADLLKKLRIIQQDFRKSRFPAAPLLDEFFLKISSSEFLDELRRILPKMDLKDKNAVDAFKQTIYLLSPKAVLALGPILLQISAQPLRHLVMEGMTLLAEQDAAPLVRLLKHPEEALVLMAVNLLGRIDGPESSDAMLEMIEHPSGQVRKAAVRALARRDRQLLGSLFDLIENPSDDIRDVLLDCLAECRGDIAETLLLDYLQERKYKRRDRSHLMACYTALGRCATTCSLPFLEKTLFSRTWFAGPGYTAHRRGAAAALKKMENREAMVILDKAGQSLAPSIRRALRKAEKKHG